MSNGGTPKATSVGVAPTTCLQENLTRARVVFCNTSANIIYLSHSPQLVTGAGIPLVANGGNFIDEYQPGNPCYKGTWYAIASGAGSNLAIEEET
jgi:hypothetical protein